MKWTKIWQCGDFQIREENGKFQVYYSLTLGYSQQGKPFNTLKKAMSAVEETINTFKD